jgi:hypothetical protein
VMVEAQDPVLAQSYAEKIAATLRQ